ncbi:autotransporter outer membrane beta-barrel domain-containing protein [Bartonella florencae]|uniref:autotransporter outer membrane beta-barrel domain-containing protein n=1 Tax=Bartonella florencae TaxID=928210 RepID=UPI00056C55F8|nr:autotransporter outer membrane beta-barrel domain-containing protein [Bartonella florencae]
MIKVLKHHVCLCALTTSVFCFTTNINAETQDSEPSCSSLFKFYSCDVFKGPHRTTILDDVRGDAYIAPADNLVIQEVQNINIDGGKEVKPQIGGTLELKNSETVTSDVLAKKNGMVILNNVSITLEDKNIKGDNGKEVSSNGKDVSRAVFAVEQGGSLFVNKGEINVTNMYGFVGQNSPVIFEKGSSNITGGYVSEVFMKDTDVTVKGDGAFGLYFRGSSSQEEYLEGELLFTFGDLQFDKTSFKVPDGTVIYSDDARRHPSITLLEGSRFSGDLLLDVKNNSFVTIEAIASSLVGGTRVDSGSSAGVELFDNSQWTVKPTKQSNVSEEEKKLQQDSQRYTSSLSLVRLADSRIIFQQPTDGRFQTLQIGPLDGGGLIDYAYAAAGKASLHVNAYLNHGRLGDTGKEGGEADQVIIYGDVYGTTTVYVNEIARRSKARGKAEQSETKVEGDNSNPGVSIIQVHGKADKDSFKLPGGYGVLNGKPYRYRLHAYAPKGSSSEGTLTVDATSTDFWDFRLERDYIKLNSAKLISRLKKQVHSRRVSRSIESKTERNYAVVGSENFAFHPEEEVSAVVPQVPTYLLLPNALFQAGLMDISNQNKQLETLRDAVGSLLENSKNPAFFVRGYGSNNRYVSDLSELQYGYGGNLGYYAGEVGFLLKEIESAHHSTSFGIMGTYGKISLQPQDVMESKKSLFDKWSITAYGSIQGDSGFYLDGLFSYGFLKGDVLTLERGKTATLQGNPLNASFVAGKRFMTGYDGLVFDPQVQVVYQNLFFDKTSDIDGFDIDMGKPDQWVMRVGGHLSKTLPATQTGNIISFNGKLHLAHSFGEKQFVHFGDKFQLGAFGSSLEAGIGFNAQLSSKFALHGDATYQHKISKAGFSGARFTGGLRYRF